MPKQIKKISLTKAEKTSRILAIAAMVSAMVFAGSLIWLLSDVMNEVNSWGCYVICACYALFFGLSAAHCIQGIYVFKKQEHYGVLFQAILTGAAAFAALVNLQFMAVMLLSALGKDDAAQKAIGSRTMDEFVQSQHTAWVLLVCGIAAVIFIGVAAILRFANTKK